MVQQQPAKAMHNVVSLESNSCVVDRLPGQTAIAADVAMMMAKATKRGNDGGFVVVVWFTTRFAQN